jgi:pimeloyl-ACP methyl ester carboxylesterase
MLTKPPLFSDPSDKTEKGCKLVNGTRLYYEMKGEGQPLVFIHAFTLDNRMWDDQFYFFSKWYCCIRYDIRGHGQSALPGSEPYTFQDDLKSLLFSLHISEPVILVGLSMGGRIASNFALQYPRFTKALVLADAQIEGFVFKRFKLDAIFSNAKKKGIDYAKSKWFAHELFASARNNKAVAKCLEQMIHFYSGWHFVDKNPVIHFNPPTWLQLKNIAVAALVIYGELDLPDFIEMSEGAALLIPGAKKAVLRNTGHMSNMENPAGFNKELQEFLESLAV